MNNWKSKKIKDIDGVEIILGQSPSSKSYNKKKNGLPFLQGKAEFGMIYPKPEIYTDVPIKIAESNDLLLSVRAPVGDINLSPFKLCIGRGLAAIRFKKDNPKFYFYWFLKNQKAIESLGVGSTFKAITGEQLKKIMVPIVELPEQTAIANILSTVDEAIQKADEAITKTERIKQAMMQKLLSEGIGNKEFKQTKIGRIPKEWELLTLESITLNITDGKHGDCQNEESSGYYFISAKDIYNSKINYGKARQITQKDFDDAHKRTKLEPNDILLTNSGSIGKTALIDFSVLSKRTTFQKSVAVIKVQKEKVNPTFLLHYLANLQPYLTSLASGTSQKNLLLKDLRALLIPVPSISEQIEITDTLQNFNLKFLLAKDRKFKLERIKQGLMDDLLAGKKRVKIN